MTINPYAWLARAPHVTLHFDRLPDGEMGRWVPEHDLIILDDRLNQAQRRCTLTHELVHRLRKHQPDLPARLHRRQEEECRREAARLLIPLEQYARALLWSWPNLYEEMAEELWVDVPTLRDRVANLTPDEVSYVSMRLLNAERHVA